MNFTFDGYGVWTASQPAGYWEIKVDRNGRFLIVERAALIVSHGPYPTLGAAKEKIGEIERERGER